MDWQKTRTFAATVGHSLSGAAGDLSRSLWLIVWFAFCFIIILLTMAAQQFQTRMNGATDDTRYTVGYVLMEVSNLAAHNAYIAELHEALRKLEGRQASANDAVEKAGESAATQKAKLTNLLSKAYFNTEGFAKLVVLDQEPLDVRGFRNSISEARMIISQFKPSDGPSLDSARQQLETFENAVQTLAQVTDRALALNAAVSRADAEYKKGSAPYGEGPFAKESFKQLADDLSRYERLLWGVPYWFVAVPNIILTLILTLLMGILGSLIALTREVVFENIDHPLGQYLFRIGLGASVALAIFLFAGAGMLTLAQGSGGNQSNVELSPYLVSFLGIVSGYLSRRVTLWMRETGAKVFPVSQEADRWAIDLKSELTSAGATSADMAGVTGLVATTIDEWAQRKAAIPYSAQQLVAAYLHKPAYKLFSDIAPPP